jgi:outer membrane protein assembly factor BamB
MRILFLILFSTSIITYSQQWNWAHQLGILERDYRYGSCNAVVADREGNIYVTGFLDFLLSFSNGSIIYPGQETFIEKYDAFGNPLWAVMTENLAWEQFLKTEAYDIQLDSMGNIYIIGDYNGNVDFGKDTLFAPYQIPFDPLNRFFFAAKYASNGENAWVTPLNSRGFFSRRLALDRQGNGFFVGEYFDTAIIGMDTLVVDTTHASFVSSFDSNGNLRWTMDFKEAVIVDIAAFPSGEVVLIGNLDKDFIIGNDTLKHEFSQQMFIVKLDSQGRYLWGKYTTGSGFHGGNALTIENNNIFIIGRCSRYMELDNLNFYPYSYRDFNRCLIKLDGDGNGLWISEAGEFHNPWPFRIDVTPDGKCYISGHFIDTAKIHNTVVRGNRSNSMFLAQFAEDGSFQWVIQDSSDSDVECNDLVVSVPNVVICGNFEDTLVFNDDTLMDSTQLFLASLLPFPISIENTYSEKHGPVQFISLFPNPYYGNSSFKFNLAAKERVSVMVYNARGQLVEKLLNSSLVPGFYELPWKAPSQASGFYFFKIEAGNFQKVKCGIQIK